MAKRLHLILLALLCLQLVAAADLPQTFLAELNGADPTELIPPVTTSGEAEQISEPESAACATAVVPVQNAAFEQELVERVNIARAAAGVPPLKYNESLSNAARYHASDMAMDEYFNHDSYDRVNGNLTLVCSVWQRVSQFYAFDAAAGENIAAGQVTPEAVLQAWMASDGHRANILGANYREIGVGYYSFGDWFQHFWVQDFGTRSSVYPVVINLESGSTADRELSLYLYGKSVFSEYRVRDDASAWSAWMPFQERAGWTLTGTGNRTRTVTVELRQPGGEVSTSSDTIYLDGQASLGNLPDHVRFLYNKETGALYSAGSILQPQNTGTMDVLSWSLSATESWINVSATSGITPDTEVIVTPCDLAGLSKGSYTGSLTFTVTAPDGVDGSPTTIPVSLTIVESMTNLVYLPVLQR